MSETKPALDRRLGVTSATMFGLSYMSPMVVIATFGAIAVKTQGAVGTAYIIAIVAMLITAISYGYMSSRMPVAGSAYTYSSSVLGRTLGFAVGWVLLLDYFFIPMVICLLTATGLSTLDPNVPFWVWVVGVAILSTVINALGITVTDRVNLVIMALQLVMVVAILYLCVRYAFETPSIGTLVSPQPFTNKDTNFSLIMAGAAVACYSFLGFDAISTLSEETVDPRRSIPRAIFIATLLGGAIFLATAYFMMLVHPSLKFASEDTAAYEIAGQIGGPFFKTVFTLVVTIAFFAAGLCAHASASRLLYVMGRDNVLPSVGFSYLHPVFKTPIINICLVGVVMLIAARLDIATSTSFINFGAFTAFCAVNLCVVVHILRNRGNDSGGKLSAAALALVGALACASLFFSLDGLAVKLGVIWLCVGIVYLACKTRCLTKPLPAVAVGE
ncbi:APC family permease (plasmid) [Burkholderia vietnamiensis]|uniref:Amino acid permease-associated region n=1 Tax=Burkholderia vietnamiensis (strain G4 / LMG 22486) TaxID=269482 RepID=A4JTE8_BURVG|nr:amino acid permease-associated region [Burkholderia vietnamiensis G4]MCB4350295.1 APC family permease [Burkholderia vietnamiensis]